jgi:hypothetical protein
MSDLVLLQGCILGMKVHLDQIMHMRIKVNLNQADGMGIPRCNKEVT